MLMTGMGTEIAKGRGAQSAEMGMEVKAGDWGTLQRLVLTVGEGRWLHLNEKAFDVQVYTEKGAPGPQEKFKSEKQSCSSRSNRQLSGRRT